MSYFAAMEFFEILTEKLCCYVWPICFIEIDLPFCKCDGFCIAFFCIIDSNADSVSLMLRTIIQYLTGFFYNLKFKSCVILPFIAKLSLLHFIRCIEQARFTMLESLTLQHIWYKNYKLVLHVLLASIPQKSRAFVC